MLEVLILVLAKYFAVLVAFGSVFLLVKGSQRGRISIAVAVAIGVYLLMNYVLAPAIWRLWMETQPPSVRILLNAKEIHPDLG